jgi:hypothetical protein
MFNLWKPLVASLIAALGMLPLRNILPMPEMLSAFFLVYIAALLALRTFDVEDRKLFRSLIPARTK